MLAKEFQNGSPLMRLMGNSAAQLFYFQLNSRQTLHELDRPCGENWILEMEGCVRVKLTQGQSGR